MEWPLALPATGRPTILSTTWLPPQRRGDLSSYSATPPVVPSAARRWSRQALRGRARLRATTRTLLIVVGDLGVRMMPQRWRRRRPLQAAETLPPPQHLHLAASLPRRREIVALASETALRLCLTIYQPCMRAILRCGRRARAVGWRRRDRLAVPPSRLIAAHGQLHRRRHAPLRHRASVSDRKVLLRAGRQSALC